MNRLALGLALLLSAGCNCGSSEATDAGSHPGQDAANEADAGSGDASAADAGGSDAALADAGADDAGDAGLADAAVDDAGADAGPRCAVGTAGSFATDQSLDLFGQVVYYADGGTLPPGRYSVQYVDGCMKYSSGQGWTIHAYADGHDAWWLVGSTTADKVIMPPGTVGWDPAAGAFANFDDCVAANLQVPPEEFGFDGGVLGVWLQDSPYSDNVAGVGGRNPKWSLTRLEACDGGGP